MILFVRNQSKA